MICKWSNCHCYSILLLHKNLEQCFYLIPACSGCPIGASANLELVDKFRYLGDMLSVEGDADAALEARIRVGWNKFRQLVPLLTNNYISLIRRGKLYSTCVRSSIIPSLTSM